MPPFVLGILLDWRTWAFVAVIAAAGWLHHDGVMSERHKWQAAMATQKAEAEKLLAEVTAQATAIETKHADLGKQLEAKNANAQTQSDFLLDANRKLAAAVGGLRDPGRRPGCSGPVPGTADAAAIGAQTDTSGILSAEATEFLLEFARAADETRDQLGTCQAWAIGIGK